MDDTWRYEDTDLYGVVNISVANLRSSPVFPAELLNQLVLGTTVPVFEEQNGFCYIRNRDAYQGWISKASLTFLSEQEAEIWQSGDRLICKSNYGVVLSEPNASAEVMTDLATCAVVKKMARQSNYFQVQLPDGRTGFAKKEIWVRESEQLKARATPENIHQTAKQFLGIPYLWGGTSSKGFDCSGFVQTVFRLLNVSLPRNSRQMAEVGENIPLENHFQQLKTGDLLFFGNTLRRITHVALYLDKLTYIHADGTVHMNSLDENSPIYNAARRETLLKVQRIVEI